MSKSTKNLSCIVLWTLLLTTIFAPLAASGDDRDLLRTSSGDSYVQVILDTSGSMHWTPPCNENDAANDIDPWDATCTSVCELGDAACAQVCPDLGCIEYIQDKNDSTPIEVIVDEQDADVKGDFVLRNRGGYIGNDAYETPSDGKGEVKYTPNLPQEGEYHVYAYWRGFGNGSAAEIPITIKHADGESIYEVDQRRGDLAFQYNYLGTYRFQAGDTGSVTIEATGDGYVVADAVRFYSLPEPATLTCIDTGYRCHQPLCPQGDCSPRLGADDPTSKFFQAKAALYEVIKEVDDISFGFATFEQDNAHVKFQHWAKRLRAAAPNGDKTPQVKIGGVDFPPIGAVMTFGTGPLDKSYTTDGEANYDCAPGTGSFSGDPRYDDVRLGCSPDYPANLEDPWEMERFFRIPKYGSNGNQETQLYVHDDKGDVYRVDFEVPDGSGSIDFTDDVVEIQLDVWECRNKKCDNVRTHDGYDNQRLFFDSVSPFVTWSNQVSRQPMRGAGFFYNQANVDASQTCTGLEPNTDYNAYDSRYDDYGISPSTDDVFYGTSYKYEIDEDTRGGFNVDGSIRSPRTPIFDSGDWIPLDWADQKRDQILERLAPNTISSPGATPDFRTAVYFADDVGPGMGRNTGNSRLDVKDNLERPVVAYGSTPLARSLADFENWYGQWSDYAAVYDPDWSCRQKFILLLTDGDETCSGVASACNAAADLLDNSQVRTFVVGFGLPDGGDALTCIAENGGTDEPFLPRNKEELVDALRNILIQVKIESRAFASASIPAVQSTAADKVLLTSFSPFPGASVWPGRVDVFRQPLPLTDDLRPDTSDDRRCDEDLQSACFLYDVGEQLMLQAPDEDDVDPTAPDFRLGLAATERRVFYGLDNVDEERPAPLRLLSPPAEDDYGDAPLHRADLAETLLEPDDYAEYLMGNIADEELTERLNFVVGEALRKKTVSIENEDGEIIGCDGQPDPAGCEYVMGDIFHANPVVINSPNDFLFFQSNWCGLEPADGTPTNCDFTSDEPRGYREFVRRTIWRRRMLVTANNDGQVHFFDAGQRVEVEQQGTGVDLEVFNDGTGTELFSYIPRGALPAVRDQAYGSSHVYSLDGSVSVSDVYIDPAGDIDDIDPTEREWRTVVLGSMREGGDVFEQNADVEGYVNSLYALDVTYPDELETEADRASRGATAFDPYLPKNDSLIPDCLAIEGSTGLQDSVSGCDTLTGESSVFPSQLWTFADTIRIDGEEYFLDEESLLLDLNFDGIHEGGVFEPISQSNGEPDLGQTWSKPVVGQIAICEGSSCDYTDPEGGSADDITSKWVAIFGGGVPAFDPLGATRGRFLYMVDIETGRAIYKRQVQGSIGASPAVIDIDQDGLLDTIYIGTTAGLMYKVDLTGLTNSGEVPRLETVDIPADDVIDWNPANPLDTAETMRVTDSAWDPFPIYITDSPIYYPATIFRIPERGDQLGLTFGTGERHDLWAQIDEQTHYITLVDEDFQRDDARANLGGGPADLPFNRSVLYTFDWDDPDSQVGENLLLISTTASQRPGWVMRAPLGGKLNGQPFTLVGILVFSIYQPSIDPAAVGDDGTYCSRNGITYRFVVDLTNGDTLFEPEDDGGSTSDPSNGCNESGRCESILDFTTAIHTDRTVTKNPQADPKDGLNLQSVTESRTNGPLARKIRQKVLERLPSNCSYNERYNIVISALRSDTGVNVYAAIPMLACPGEWKQ